MTTYIKLKESNCKSCYKCIRSCPVKAIRFSDQQANIVIEECILCGECVVSCPQNAKEVRSDVWLAEQLILSGAPVYASVAPSFAANYEGATIESIRNALAKLGFYDAEETAVGATVVKKEYERLVREGKQKVIISTSCHSINSLIQKYYPEALPYTAHVLSPMLVHGKQLKQRDPAAKTVFIGPCISKKEEAELYGGMIDCVLTFEEFDQWLRKRNIKLEQQPRTPSEDGRTRLFPITGGILRTMEQSPDYSYLAIDGVQNCMAALEDIVNGGITNCFIEMSACHGSCVGGPAVVKEHRATVRDTLSVVRYAGEKDFTVEMPSNRALQKNIPYIGIGRKEPSVAQIEEVLRKIGKTKPEHELNCGTCGYATCRDKAIAVIQGKADLTMCLPYLIERAESFSDNIIKNTPEAIIVLNEQLEVQQINTAALQLLNIRDQNDVLGNPVIRILDPQIYTEVMRKGRDDFDRRLYLAEYDRCVMQTVIYDRSHHILIILLRDITVEEKERTAKNHLNLKAIEITDKVIEKQMRTVQEIASLLGETTAETKVALTHLKESLGHD